MILLSFFTTVEFYVIAAFIAAAVLAYAAMPAAMGPARTFLYAGVLDEGVEASEAAIVAEVADDGTLVIYRYGLQGAEALSIAVKIIGLDVAIEERFTQAPRLTGSQTATFRLDCLGRERYHIRYHSEYIDGSAAFTLNIRPGNTITRRLT